MGLIADLCEGVQLVNISTTFHVWVDYLVVHPTNRKWVTTLVINGIGGVSHL